MAAMILTILILPVSRANDTASISITFTPVQPSGNIDELNKTRNQKAWVDEHAFEIVIFHLLEIAISATLIIVLTIWIKRGKSYPIHNISKNWLQILLAYIEIIQYCFFMPQLSKL